MVCQISTHPPMPTSLSLALALSFPPFLQNRVVVLLHLLCSPLRFVLLENILAPLHCALYYIAFIVVRQILFSVTHKHLALTRSNTSEIFFFKYGHPFLNFSMHTYTHSYIVIVSLKSVYSVLILIGHLTFPFSFTSTTDRQIFFTCFASLLFSFG